MNNFPPVLILAGGLGTRIKSLSGDLPKSMVPVNGQPFILHQLQLLVRNGVSDVVLCVGHQSQALIDYVGTGKRFGLNVQYSHDGDRLLGTGGAVTRAGNLVGSPFAVLYGDSYLEIDYAAVYQAFQQSHKQGLMTVFHNQNRLIPSNVLFRDGAIVEYNKTNPAPVMQHADFGLLLFQRSAFPSGEPTQPFDLSDTLQKLISEKQLAGFETQQRFFEVGTPAGVHDLEEYLSLQQQRR